MAKAIGDDNRKYVTGKLAAEENGVGKECSIIVGTVSDVQDIEPAVSASVSADTSFILGMSTVGKCVKIMLDIDDVLTTDDIVNATVIATAAAPRAIA